MMRRVLGGDLAIHDDDFAEPWLPHQTVFFQHGFCRNSNVWRGWVPQLARHYRVIRLDTRGCGDSADPGPGYEYSIDGLVADFLGVLDALDIDSVHYIGESCGALIGGIAASRHPERFASLTFVSTPLGSGEMSAPFKSLGYPDWIAAMRALGLREWRLRSWEAMGEIGVSPAADSYFLEEFARTPLHVAEGIAKAIAGTDLRPWLVDLKMPILILAPDGASKVHPNRNIDPAGLKALLPQARWHLIENAQQGMYYRVPDLLARLTLEFIQSLGVGSGQAVARRAG
jgi:3-oxoadipate enol-lactonase